MQRLGKLLLTIALLYVGIVIVFALLESTLMYPAPNPADGDWEPTDFAYEDVFASASDGNQVHGWYCPLPGANTTVLFCHGNGEHVAWLADDVLELQERFGVNVLVFDYRGYGKSQGSPGEEGILRDAEAIYGWLAEKHKAAPEHKTVLWGRSIGGAVAIHLAATGDCNLLILDRTFDSMVNVASSRFPWLPVRLMLRNRYPSAARIQGYSGPVFQVHGRNDEVVPFRFGQQLHQSLSGNEAEFLDLDNLPHNYPWPENVYTQLKRFWQSVL
ncbi:MAG TPA: alpha/beta hydrolase [Planctomycetaceae bacterium]|nr:alpha/beta hydrolase [Planctomycetaceae bacterium]